MISGYPPGRHRFTIPTPVAEIPALLLRGARPGPVLVTTAAVHGDEFEGVRAIYELFEELDSASLAGHWLAVPIANPLAYAAAKRVSPQDQGNLARVFPGNRHGRPTEILAWHLGHQVIAHADFYLDLHSGGVGWRMPSMVGYHAADPRSRDAALAFGAETIWGHPEIAPGRTVSFAAERNIPFLYTEARGAGRVHPADLLMMKRGVRNLLRHLGILEGAPEPVPLRHHLYGEGDIHRGINAPCAGFFLPNVALLEPVVEGQPLGRLVDRLGLTIARFTAPSSGVIGLLREFPPVEVGDPLFLIASMME